ncbi:MAG: pyruvate kinase [Bacteroidota bacterium]
MALQIVDHQRTKIVATIGPASSSYEMLLKLVQAGVDVFRLNFSHGTHEDHKKVIDHIVAINEEYGTHVAILTDLQGPKLRIGEMENGGIEVEEGDILTFVNEACTGTKNKIYMSYDRFPQDVEVGEHVLVDDGKLLFEVLSTNKKDTVKLKVLFGGTLCSRKGVNLPNTKISLPSLTPKDEEDLAFILTQPAVNWIALSFVRTAEDMKNLQRKVDEKNHPAKILAKIEKPEAIENIDKIIKASNGIMVARGDLGIEIPMETLPLAQKMIIKKCIQRARPVIVATHMMDSMISSPTPTRAEITDVANAVLDGTDAVMLSGETSVGRYPAKVVEAMNKIIEQAEKHYAIDDKRPKPAKKSRTFLSDAICFNAAKVSDEVDAKALVGMTASGYTAFKLSSYRPKTEIKIFSDSRHMINTLSIAWGVRCHYYDKFTTTDETIEDVTNILRISKVVKKGDIVVSTGSMPIKKRHRTNMMKITVVE